MLRNFFVTQNVIGRLFIVLLFAGGVVFAGAFDGFVVETEASSCCGGGMDAAIFSSSNCCDEDEPDPCTCIDNDGDTIECSYCDSAPEDGCGTNSCHSDCPQTECGEDCDADCEKAGDACGKPTKDGECPNIVG